MHFSLSCPREFRIAKPHNQFLNLGCGGIAMARVPFLGMQGQAKAVVERLEGKVLEEKDIKESYEQFSHTSGLNRESSILQRDALPLGQTYLR